MTIEQLELLSSVAVEQIQIGISRFMKTDTLYYCAKQKLREVLLRRVANSEEAFSWGLHDEKACVFSSNIEGDNETGWGGEYFWSMCDDRDYLRTECGILDEYDDIPIDWIFEAMFVITGVLDGEGGIQVAAADTIKPQDETGYLPRSKSFADVKVAVEGLIKDFFIYGDDEEAEGKVEDASEEIALLLIAMDKAEAGLIEEAMETDIFASLVRGFADLYGSFVSEGFIARHLLDCVYPFVYGCSEEKAGLVLMSSKEVYMYREYKDRLPYEVRATMDRALELYGRPFPWMPCDYAEYDDEIKSHIMLTCTHDVELEDMNVFWKDIRDYLAAELPKLRKEYMPNTTFTGFSGSPDGEPDSFFVLNSVCDSCYIYRASVAFSLKAWV